MSRFPPATTMDALVRRHLIPPFLGEPLAVATVPIRTVSEINRHEHWRYRQKRAKAQHECIWASLWIEQSRIEGLKHIRLDQEPPLHIHLTRLAYRKLDTDNLAGALKHVRDAVAKFLGVDDGDESKVTWSVGQEKSKTYAVRIEFYSRQK